MKNKVIAAFYFFLSSVTSFAIYAFTTRSRDLVLPLFICLALGALVAIGVERYKKMPAKQN